MAQSVKTYIALQIFDRKFRIVYKKTLSLTLRAIRDPHPRVTRTALRQRQTWLSAPDDKARPASRVGLHPLPNSRGWLLVSCSEAELESSSSYVLSTKSHCFLHLSWRSRITSPLCKKYRGQNPNPKKRSDCENTHFSIWLKPQSGN